MSYLIGERFCKAINESGFYTKRDVMKALKIIYTGSIEERISFVFRMFDFNSDGFITSSDVKLLLSHIPMASIQELDSCFNFFVESQIEIISLVNDSFKKGRLDVCGFMQLTFGSASDIFLAVYF